MPSNRYATNDPNEIVTVAGIRQSILDVMTLYRPVFYLHNDIDDNITPDELFCDSMHSGDALLFNYYLKWPDEKHPVYPIHLLYRMYRSYYYGSPADIEYIQLEVNLNTGNISRLAFERDPRKNPHVLIPKHELVTAQKTFSSVQFHVYIAGDRVVPRNFDFEDRRLKILVSTWNHTYDFYNGKGKLLKDPPFTPMTDQVYQKYYMERRSRPPGV